MEIGFIGLGNMGFPIARRLIQENHDVIAFLEEDAINVLETDVRGLRVEEVDDRDKRELNGEI